MKAISKRQHQLIIDSLQQLEELSEQRVLPSLTGGGSADGFLSSIQSLAGLYRQYEALIDELARCIAEYEALHKEVRVNVVAPAMRQASLAYPENKKAPAFARASFFLSGWQDCFSPAGPRLAP